MDYDDVTLIKGQTQTENKPAANLQGLTQNKWQDLPNKKSTWALFSLQNKATGLFFKEYELTCPGRSLSHAPAQPAEQVSAIALQMHFRNKNYWQQHLCNTVLTSK